MLTDRERDVPSDIFLPSKEVATNDAPEYGLRLNQGIRTNHLVLNAQLRTQLIAVHHSKVRTYKGAPQVGYGD